MSALLASLVEIAVVLFALSSMLSVGVGHDWRHLIGPLRNTRAVIGALLANFVLVPLLMIGILQFVPLDRPLSSALFLVATAAGAPFLIKLTEVAQSNVAFSATRLVLLLPVTMLYMPIIVPLVLPQARMSALAIARPLILTMLLPLALGLLVRAIARSCALRVQPLLGKLSSTALGVLTAATILANGPGILSILFSRAIVAALALIGGAFLIGQALGGRELERREVLGLGTAQRNIAAATVVAAEAIGDPTTVSMVVVSSLLGLAVLFPIAALMRKRRIKEAGSQ
jgi:BASS family bile acid:Na+ symporter